MNKTECKDRPIIFSGPSVLAIQRGLKSQTRRVVKPQPKGNPPLEIRADGALCDTTGYACSNGKYPIVCPFGVPGDRLWVRETWAKSGHGCGICYLADFEGTGRPSPVDLLPDSGSRWSPSIHMPRWASRITLEITGVRVERMQEITCGDLRAEGANHKLIKHNLQWYQTLWDSINAKRGFGWDVNPWVWVIEFRKL